MYFCQAILGYVYVYFKRPKMSCLNGDVGRPGITRFTIETSKYCGKRSFSYYKLFRLETFNFSAMTQKSVNCHRMPPIFL